MLQFLEKPKKWRRFQSSEDMSLHFIAVDCEERCELLSTRARACLYQLVGLIKTRINSWHSCSLAIAAERHKSNHHSGLHVHGELMDRSGASYKKDLLWNDFQHVTRFQGQIASLRTGKVVNGSNDFLTCMKMCETLKHTDTETESLHNINNGLVMASSSLQPCM